MDALAEHARTSYRAIVYETEGFVDYFRAATPESELEDLTIGSRPARRRAGGGVETLRAIPWVFAWTQTRLMLPSWLGVGEALDAAHEAGAAEELSAMYAQWPFFRSTLDLIEMVLAKADGRIAAHYESVLVPSALHTLGADLRRRLPATSAGRAARRRPQGVAGRQSRPAPIDRRSQPLRRSHQPRASGTAPPAPPVRR
jgi:phosphoenolpyruvate carboxylase